ncbi:hypothetical protein PVAP13_7KG009600 [Panicum virgatum]|uniref:DUF4283 domain-containing protein n=1 Tax=Panicum virgatum TaxID=38727 RepID=A0A8T0QKH7_PANVG|nr:hypothetical protein PVAP13_7KG009600 [Panicum virgatum]
MDFSLLDFRHGSAFAKKVHHLLHSSVVPSTPDDAASFWMIIASFSRSKFRLDLVSVELILESVLGGLASLFSVVEIDQWVFKFCVASSKVGFMIYALKSFACTDFKIHFHLWNEFGLSQAKATVRVDHTSDFQWIEVQSKRSKKSVSAFAKGSTSRIPPLTGSNAVPGKRKNKSAAMAGISKPGDIDAANIQRPNVQQLPAEHQGILDDIQKKIREEKEKEIQRLEEEAMKQYISHFSIDRQEKVTTDAGFDDSEQPVLNSEIANAIDDAVSSHANNKLEFIGQNMHDMFDDRFSRIEIHLGMKSVGVSEVPRSQMAFHFVDPMPFLPRGSNRVHVEGRKPMTQAILGGARRSNNDFAIAIIEPLPELQVSFTSIRELLDDFLCNHRQVGFRTIQPCPLGQAYIRFNYFHDCDFLIQNRWNNKTTSMQYDVWLMLLGFNVDYWDHKDVEKAVSDFGTLLVWEEDPSHLSRIIVKASVVDLTEIPWFIVCSEGENFEGKSWTTQCEILQATLLGGGPPDEEDPPNGPDDLQPHLFEFFGFGQPGHGPHANPPENVNQPMEVEGWGLWPEHQPVIGPQPGEPFLEVNDLVQPQENGIDLNEPLEENLGGPSLHNVLIPHPWTDFFTALLLNPSSFNWAKQFLSSQAWNLLSANKPGVAFSLPTTCPVKLDLPCLQELHIQDFSTSLEDPPEQSSPKFLQAKTSPVCSVKGKEKIVLEASSENVTSEVTSPGTPIDLIRHKVSPSTGPWSKSFLDKAELAKQAAVLENPKKHVSAPGGKKPLKKKSNADKKDVADPKKDTKMPKK